MTTLLVGFDSAWTATKSGAIVGAVHAEDGTFRAIGLPQCVNFREAEDAILEWQSQENPETTVVLLDQPTIVPNTAGQRPVENLVSSVVGRRGGGMQPAYATKKKMFDKHAPIWPFLARFGGPADPQELVVNTVVFETYPVLAVIALGWTLPDSQLRSGRLPKYNPKNRNFAISDWQHVCKQTLRELEARRLMELVRWLGVAADNSAPGKSDQDSVDACICLLVALHLAELREYLMVGNMRTGYIMAPADDNLCAELQARCVKTGRDPAEWVRSLVLKLNVAAANED